MKLTPAAAKQQSLMQNLQSVKLGTPEWKAGFDAALAQGKTLTAADRTSLRGVGRDKMADGIEGRGAQFPNHAEQLTSIANKMRAVDVSQLNGGKGGGMGGMMGGFGGILGKLSAADKQVLRDTMPPMPALHGMTGSMEKANAAVIRSIGR